MKTYPSIIGLGNAGTQIATLFAKLPEYKTVYRIDTEQQEEKLDNCTDLFIPVQSKPEEYETKLPSVKKHFKGLKGDVLFIVAGGGSVSLSSLAILETIKKSCKITILYIQPDTEFLGAEGRLKERAVFNVFQEYARSGLFEQMWIVSNTKIENVLGGVSIISYYSKINETIVSSFHYLMTLQRTKAVTDTFSSVPIGARICTLGIVDPTTNKDKMFFDLDLPTDMEYYFAYNETTLQKDVSLLNKIKTLIRTKIENGISRVSYGVFATTYNNNIIICALYSPEIQK